MRPIHAIELGVRRLRRPPKVVMTLLVRDEEDIIKQNLDFHLSQGVDFFIVTNNQSIDSTPDILAEYERAGLAAVMYEGSNSFLQAEWVTRMARMAANEYRADWVINNDADEFWFGTDKRLKSVLRAVSNRVSALEVQRHQFLPPHPLRSGSPWWQSMVYRERQPRNYLGSPLPPKVCHRAHRRIEVESGNHKIAAPANASPFTVGRSSELEIAHFPLRGLTRLEASLRRLEHIFRARPPIAGRTPGGAKYKLFQLLQEGRLKEFYEQLLPELNCEGELLSTDRHTEDGRVGDMIEQLVV